MRPTRWPRRSGETARKAMRQKPVFAVWLGEDAASARAFERVRIPHFATEADAVRGFMQLVRLPRGAERADGDAGLPAARLCAGCRRPPDGSSTGVGRASAWLDPMEVNGAACAPTTFRSRPSPSPRRPTRPPRRRGRSSPTGGTVAVKILSPDIVHKSDIGGVQARPHDRGGGAQRRPTDILERAARLDPARGHRRHRSGRWCGGQRRES